MNGIMAGCFGTAGSAFGVRAPFALLGRLRCLGDCVLPLDVFC